MKILYPIEGSGGGAVTHVLTLAKHLPKGKYQPFIVFLLDGPSVKVARDLGLQVSVVPKRPGLNLALIWKLTKILNKEVIDIVHTHTIRGNFYGRMAVLLCKKKTTCVTTIHSFIVDELKGSNKYGLKDWILSKREVWSARFTNKFIAVSNKIKSGMVKNGIAENKITVIENGVETPDLQLGRTHEEDIRKEFDIDADDIIIGTIGRLVELKNHHIFIKAARQVVATVPNAKFLIVGDGELFEELNTLAKKLKINDNVIFTGWRNDIQKLTDAMDLYVICSRIEGLNISVLEAMASAKPVVGTNVKGIAESVIDGETGLLVPPDDIDSLASAISRVIENKDLARQMGIKGRERITGEYSMSKNVQKNIDIYEGIRLKTMGSAN